MPASTRVPWLVAAGLWLSAHVLAQPASPPARPDPLDARASVPPARHDSVLQRYRGGGEVKVGNWKDANDTVTRIGGWRSYLREAAQPEAPASAPAAGGGHGPHRKP
jgi:hypothetical protein